MITLLSFQGLKRSTESNQAKVVGEQMATVGRAVDTYIATRYSPITQLSNAAGTPADPGPRTCAGTTCTITVATLVNEGLLPATYQNLNSYGSGYTIALTVGGTTPSWNVNGLVTTSLPWTTSGVVRYDLLGQAMAAAGADSGMSRLSPNRIDGYGGVWSATLTSGATVGLLGFQVGDGTSMYAIYLRRDGTLPMTGDLNMSDGIDHNINNASSITGTGRFTSNQAYTSYVNLAGNLDMSGSASIAGNASVAGSLGAGGSISATGVIYSASSLQTNGDVDANGSLSTGGNVTANGAMYSRGDINTSGSLFTGQNVSTSGYVIPQGGAAVGVGCGPNGAIGNDGSQPLFCKNGVWSSSGSSTHVSSFGMPGGVDGTWDIGWHNYCALSNYDTDQRTAPGVFPVGGPNGAGQYDWNLSTCNPGCNGGSFGTGAICLDVN